jgi:DinB superfamily
MSATSAFFRGTRPGYSVQAPQRQHRSDNGPGAKSLVHCLSHGGSHLEHIRHLQPFGQAHAEVPNVFRLSHQSQNESEQKMFKRLMAGAAIAILACSAATSLRAQEVTQAEKERAIQYLESTKKGVLEATKGLSDAQWNFKAGPDRWSIAQVMEHIAASEDFIRQMDAEKVMLAPAVPGRDLKKTDDAVIAMVPDRSQKAQAPEPLVPTNRFGTPDGSVKHFVESRAKTEDFLKTTPGLRDHAVDSPMGSKLDGYEFVLLIAAHSERHTKQILEVKADPNYPKN